MQRPPHFCQGKSLHRHRQGHEMRHNFSPCLTSQISDVAAQYTCGQFHKKLFSCATFWLCLILRCSQPKFLVYLCSFSCNLSYRQWLHKLCHDCHTWQTYSLHICTTDIIKSGRIEVTPLCNVCDNGCWSSVGSKPDSCPKQWMYRASSTKCGCELSQKFSLLLPFANYPAVTALLKTRHTQIQQLMP